VAPGAVPSVLARPRPSGFQDATAGHGPPEAAGEPAGKPSAGLPDTLLARAVSTLAALVTGGAGHALGACKRPAWFKALRPTRKPVVSNTKGSNKSDSCAAWPPWRTVTPV
jgi:hypothetical protein